MGGEWKKIKLVARLDSYGAAARGRVQIWLWALWWPSHRGKQHGLQAAAGRNSNFSTCGGVTAASPTAAHKEQNVGCSITVTSLQVGAVVIISLDASQRFHAQTRFAECVGG